MKEILKKLLVPALSSSVVSYFAEKMVCTGTTIFMFHRFNSTEHGVSGHDPVFLDKCLQYLKDHNYSFVSLEQIVDSIRTNSPLPKRSIAFTIDDGFLDQATIAAPVFLKHNCPVTIFLITGMIDNELWPWDDKIAYLVKHSQQNFIQLEIDGVEKSYTLQDSESRQQATRSIQNWFKTLDAGNIPGYINKLSDATLLPVPEDPPSNYQAMSWDMARELEKKGITFGPHTKSHLILSQLNDKIARQEIEHSWARLTEELASPTPIFCYPTGRDSDFTQREVDNLIRMGLKGAVSTQPTFIDMACTTNNGIYRLPRFSFPDSHSDFVQYSSWIERAKKHLLRG